MMRHGTFIAFEGGEGSGKSTQARLLAARLRRLDRQVCLVQEPGGTPLGRAIRALVKWPRGTPPSKDKAFEAASGEQLLMLPMVPEAEVLLFCASRAQLIADVVQPELARGHTVISDRYIYSTLAYQGYGRGLDLDLIRTLNIFATRGIIPDLVILMDIDAATGVARSKRKKEVARYEEEDMAFHERVRQGYLRMASEDPGRWVVIDAGLPKTRITQVVWDEVTRRLDIATAARPRRPRAARSEAQLFGPEQLSGNG